MVELFTGSGIAHTILLISLTIGIGLFLGKYKIKGISIGGTWILFVGIIFSHFGLRADPGPLAFVKDFGLILFVYSIGLQVGPGFFQSFKKDGLAMNLMSVMMVLLAVITTYIIHLVSGEDFQTMVGVMSGAVTNTPGLGAAQQTIQDVMVSEGAGVEAAADASAELTSAYAVAYPIGVLGVIAVLILFKSLFHIDLDKEQEKILSQMGVKESARRMHCEVTNPGLFGKKVSEVLDMYENKFVISRIMRDGKESIVDTDTVLEEGDKILLVTSPSNVDNIRMIFGKEVPMHLEDWIKTDNQLMTKKMTVTKAELTGKTLYKLRLRTIYGVTVTRVHRAGTDLVAVPSLSLQMGDDIIAVGPEKGLKQVAELVGNSSSALAHPSLIPIFLGIVLGIIVGMIPFKFPGIPQPVRIGLAGGPLIVAILIGHFGPKIYINTYTTPSANMMLREIGIDLFLAAVGLGAGENFVSALTNGGFMWILYGALITFIPLIITALVSHYALKLNFFQICGVLTGTSTNPPALSFAQGAYGSDYTSVYYATVYPLSMFLRVLVAQILVLIAFA